MRNMMRAALGLIVAVPLAAGRPDAAKIDVGGVPSLDGHGAQILKQGLYTVLFTDTGANQYSLWSTTQRNLYAENDTIVACYRRLGDGSLGSGALAISWSVDGGMNWLTAWPVNEGINGDPAAGALGRYPHAVKDPLSPGCSWPELEPSPAWGFEGAAYTIDYTDPSQIFGAINGGVNDQVHKNDLYEINGIWWGVAVNVNDTFFVVQFDPASATFTSIQPSQTLTGVMYPEAVKKGTDGSVVVFGMNGVSGNFGFAVLNTSTGDFDPIVDFGPDTTIIRYDWLDGAYFGGNAMLVAAVYTDSAAALANELHGLYYDAATGTTTVLRLDDPTTDPHYIHYPQVVSSADGQYVAVLWAQSQDTVMDAAVGGFHWDLWIRVSLDGGLTWYPAVNIGDTAVNEVMPHVNGFITSAGDLYFMFGVSSDTTNYPNWDMYYETIAGSALVPPEYNFAKLNIFTAVEERRADVRMPASLAFDLRTRTLRLVASSNISGEARVELLDVTGRVVRTLPVTLRNGAGSTTFGELAKGTYLVRVSLPNGEQVNGKIWVAR